MSTSRIRSALSVLTAESLLLEDAVSHKKDDTIFTEEALQSIIRAAEIFNGVSTVHGWLQKRCNSFNNPSGFSSKIEKADDFTKNGTDSRGMAFVTKNRSTVRKASPRVNPRSERTSPLSRRNHESVNTPSNSRRGSFSQSKPQKVPSSSPSFSTVSINKVNNNKVESYTITSTPIRASQRTQLTNDMYGILPSLSTTKVPVYPREHVDVCVSSRPVSALRTSTTTPIRTTSDLNTCRYNMYAAEEGRYAITPFSTRHKTAIVVNNGSSTKKKSPSLYRTPIGKASPYGRCLNNVFSRQSTGTSIGELGGSTKDHFETPVVSYKELWHKGVMSAGRYLGSTNVLLSVRLETLEELENILKEGSEELVRYTLHEKDYFCADSSHLMPLLTYQLKTMDAAILRRIIRIAWHIVNIAGPLFASLHSDTYIARILWLMDCPIATEPVEKVDIDTAKKYNLQIRDSFESLILYDIIAMHISTIVENVRHERILCHLVEHLRWINGSNDRSLRLPALVSSCDELSSVHSAKHPYQDHHEKNNNTSDKSYLDFRSRSIAAHISEEDPTSSRYKRSKDLCSSLGFSILDHIASKTCLKVKYVIDDLICPNEFTVPFLDDFSLSDDHKAFAYPAPYWSDLKARRIHKKLDSITESVILTAQPLSSGACPLELLRHSISLREKVSLEEVIIIRSSDKQELADGDVLYEMGLHPVVKAYEDLIARSGQELSAMIMDTQKSKVEENLIQETLSKVQRESIKDKSSSASLSRTMSFSKKSTPTSSTVSDSNPFEMSLKCITLDNTIATTGDMLKDALTNDDFRHQYDSECLGPPLPGCSAILQTGYRRNREAAQENTKDLNTYSVTQRASHVSEYTKPDIIKTRTMQGELRLKFVSAVASAIWETIILPIVGDTSRNATQVPCLPHVLEVFMVLFPVHCNHLFYTSISMEQRREVLKICMNREIKHLHNMPLFMAAMVDECPPKLYEEYIKFSELPRGGKTRFRVARSCIGDENPNYSSRPSISKVLFVPLIDSATEKVWQIYHRRNRGQSAISVSKRQIGGPSVMRIPNKDVASSYVCRADTDALGCGVNMPNFLHMLGPAGSLTPRRASHHPIPLRNPSPSTPFYRSRSRNSYGSSEPIHRLRYSIRTLSRVANPSIEGRTSYMSCNKDSRNQSPYASYNKTVCHDSK